MSYLTRVEDRREDEMADYAYVEEYVQKVYAYAFRGYYDKIPQFFKKGVRFLRYDEAERKDIVTCYDTERKYDVELRVDDYIVVKGDKVEVLSWQHFSALYKDMRDFLKYE